MKILYCDFHIAPSGIVDDQHDGTSSMLISDDLAEDLRAQLADCEKLLLALRHGSAEGVASVHATARAVGVSRYPDANGDYTLIVDNVCRRVGALLK